jgi:hypothetical protein
MSKHHIENDEWDASDASDEPLRTPKTPGSPVSKASSLSWPKSPNAYMSESPKVESPREESPRAESPRAETWSPKYSDVSQSFKPTSPTAYMCTEEDRAYEAR